MKQSNYNLNITEEKQFDPNLINYLINPLNNFPILHEGIPLFMFEFYVFEMVLPKEVFLLLNEPLLSFRLLDYPTQNITGKLDTENYKVTFNTGKTCFFEMELEHYKNFLVSEPLYVMLIDINYGEMKILATSKVNVSVFSFDQFSQYSGTPPLPRRNVLKLFDNKLETVCEFDLSLLIRREYFKYNIQDSKEPCKEVKLDKDKNIIPKKVETRISENKSQSVKLSQSLSNNQGQNYEGNFEINPKSKELNNKSIVDSKNETKTKINTNKSLNSREARLSKQSFKQQDFIPQVVQQPIVQSQVVQQQVKINPSSKNYAKELHNFLSGQSMPPPLYFNSKKSRVKNSIDEKQFKKESENKVKNNEDINLISSKTNNEDENIKNRLEFEEFVQFKKKKIDKKSGYEEKMKEVAIVVTSNEYNNVDDYDYLNLGKVKETQKELESREKKLIDEINRLENIRHQIEKEKEKLIETPKEKKIIKPLLVEVNNTKFSIIGEPIFGRESNIINLKVSDIFRSSDFFLLPTKKSIENLNELDNTDIKKINSRYEFDSKVSIEEVDNNVEEILRTPYKKSITNSIQEELSVNNDKSISVKEEIEISNHSNNKSNKSQSIQEEIIYQEKKPSNLNESEVIEDEVNRKNSVADEISDYGGFDKEKSRNKNDEQNEEIEEEIINDEIIQDNDGNISEEILEVS